MWLIMHFMITFVLTLIASDKLFVLVSESSKRPRSKRDDENSLLVGRLQPNEDLKKSFMDSLICNTSPEAKLLTCFEALDPHLSQNRIPKAIAGQSQAEQTCQCPYPEIGTYILSCVGQVCI